ncbi:hypothetical protein CDV31_002186 [Fusarium ambrosium]|uniref:Zn(2)-C6 fungal-type domain-containing protein n=1 Tax=Fusarium ambrosium TaxID=131363 RepID=A0A428UXL7_9HYPO|nr:hypothetical protein CDV31_002186 [Fusarium ambrosium]
MNRPDELNHSPGSSLPAKQPACRQCRARKVKCDRRTTGCVRCERLDLACSYLPSETVESFGNSRGQDLTQAGIKRRRILRACVSCRSAKVKCSGTHPCDRCRSHAQACEFGDGVIPQSEAFASPVSPPPTDHGSVPSQLTPAGMSNITGDDSFRLFEAEDRDVVRQYLDTYFDKANIADCVFLHRGTTIAEWSQGKLDKTLLKAICAAGLRHTPAYHSMAYSWMKQVQNELAGHLGDMSIPKLQALMLAVKFLSSLRFTGDVVLRYTRRVILDGSSPFHSRGQLRSLDLELASFEESLPEELQLNDNRLMLMCHSDEARPYTMLHTLLFSCRCDLHRFLIPGIRESVSPEAAAQTPREYIDYCQRRCLQSALGSCDLWSKIRHLETSSRVETPTLAVVTYQSVKIIDHLASLLPAHGDDSLPVVKEKLADALFIAARIQTGVDWIASCISDIEKLIPSPPPGNLRLQEKLHRRSKHAYAPDDEEELDPAVNPPESNQDEALPTEDVQSATPIDSLAQGSWPFSLPGDNQDMFASNQGGSGQQPLGYNLMNYDLTNSADVVFGEHDMVFPMDPFDLQLNAYTDANVPHYIGSE